MQGKITFNGKEISWQTTFSDEAYFECQHCGHCCCASDVKLSEREAKNLDKKHLERIDQGYRIRDSLFKECIFHNHNRCSIYELRPGMCREFPFMVCFVSKNKAYIDVLYSCKSNIGKKFGKNIINFEELVKNRVLNYEINFDFEKQVNEMEKNLKISNWKNKIAQIKNDLLDLYHLFEPGEKVNYHFFIEKFFNFYKDYVKKLPSYKGLNLETGERCSIDVKGDSIEIGKIINTKNLKRRYINPEAKQEIIKYFQNIFSRKTTVVDFYLAFKHLNASGHPITVEELQKEMAKRMFLMFQFFLLIISEKNDNPVVQKNDVLETIFALDCSLFTPMQSMLPGIKKKSRFFS